MDTQETNVLVKLTDISLVERDKVILSNINLTIYHHSIITIVGPNGGGKSTLLKIILGLVKPTQGKIYRKNGINIGYVPQKISLDRTLPLTVQKFLSLTEHHFELDEILSKLSISHLQTQSMHNLSGGEMQRVLLARALLSHPQLLILDEPVQGVDLTGQAELYQLIQAFALRMNCAVLMVSHDLHLVMASTHEVLCVNQHLCCAGTPQAVSEHPAFIQHFGDQFARQFALYTHNHNHRHDLHGEVCCPSLEKIND